MKMLLARVPNIILILTFSFALATPSLSIAANGVEKTSISTIINHLRKINVSSDDPNIPLAAIPLLTEFKHKLRDLILNTINETHMSGKTAFETQRIVLEKLKGIGIKVEDKEDDTIKSDLVEPSYAYGRILRISIYRPASHPDLLVATTTIGISCGEDTSLYLFKERKSQWSLILTQEVNGYNSIDAAQGLFGYGISNDSGKYFYLVTVNITPWCTSNWQRIRYNVFRITSRSYESKLIISGKDTIYLGVESSPYRLHVKSQSFTLKYYGGDKLNPDGTAPLKTIRYQFKGDQALKETE